MGTDTADVRTVNDIKTYFTLPKVGADRDETEDSVRSQVRSSRCI